MIPGVSQTYEITVSASVRVEVRAGDRQRKRLVLTEIVPQDEQREILRERALARGWEADPSDAQVLVRKQGDVEERLDLRELAVEAQVERQETVVRERTIVVRGDLDREAPEARRKREREQLERQLAPTDGERAEAERILQREIAARLEETEEARDRELNELVREVYAEGLKRKAGQLGQVTEVREGQAGDDYELVIRITE